MGIGLLMVVEDEIIESIPGAVLGFNLPIEKCTKRVLCIRLSKSLRICSGCQTNSRWMAGSTILLRWISFKISLIVPPVWYKGCLLTICSSYEARLAYPLPERRCLGEEAEEGGDGADCVAVDGVDGGAAAHAHGAV